MSTSRSSASIPPYTACTSTSAGLSPFSATSARRCNADPSCGSPSSWDSTCNTVTPGHALSTSWRHSASALVVTRREPRGRLRRRGVQLLDVLPNHPGGDHLRPERLEGVPDHLHPSSRDAGLVAVIEPGRDLVLDDVVESHCLDIVAPVRVGQPVSRRNGPAVLAVEPLVPPSVA